MKFVVKDALPADTKVISLRQDDADVDILVDNKTVAYFRIYDGQSQLRIFDISELTAAGIEVVLDSE